jgi:site-specific DNA-methyltransferase (adenine-specific)
MEICVGNMHLYRDHFQNYRNKGIPKAQLIIADIPYNIGNYAYASNPSWYKDGDNKNGESELAGKTFFDTDKDFRIPEFMHFVSTMLKKEPKETGQAGCMIVFCEFEQQFMLIEEGKKYGFNHYINLVFRKNYSAQVLKANMKIVGNCEYAMLLYRDKLPKFRNNGRMIFNCVDIPENYCFDYQRDTETPKIHPNQKSIFVLKNLIEIFTDLDDVVIDPCAGSGITLLAAEQLGRKSYGFEIKKEFVDGFNKKIAHNLQTTLFQQEKRAFNPKAQVSLF